MKRIVVNIIFVITYLPESKCTRIFKYDPNINNHLKFVNDLEPIELKFRKTFFRTCGKILRFSPDTRGSSSR